MLGNDVSKIPVILLIGGAGTRIRAVWSDRPKPLIPCAGRPFLEWVIEHFKSAGLRDFVISMGHMAEVAQDHFENRPDDGCRFRLVREPMPMGTGGAIRFAATEAGLQGPFLVANADSLAVTDMKSFVAGGDDPDVDGLLLGVQVEDASRFGSLDIQDDQSLIGFREKEPGRGVINAGVYLLRSELLDDFDSEVPLSIEHDTFPHMLQRGRRLNVHVVEAPFIDIGTPESLQDAESFIQKHFT